MLRRGGCPSRNGTKDGVGDRLHCGETALRARRGVGRRDAEHILERWEGVGSQWWGQVTEGQRNGGRLSGRTVGRGQGDVEAPHGVGDVTSERHGSWRGRYGDWWGQERGRAGYAKGGGQSFEGEGKEVVIDEALAESKFSRGWQGNNRLMRDAVEEAIDSTSVEI